MKFVAISGALLAVATTVRGQEGAPSVPSGIDLTLQEVLREEQSDGTFWLRFRYVAPSLASEGYETVRQDFAALCETQVLPYVAAGESDAAQAVISIASEETEFGLAAPGVTQFFEAFSLIDDTCQWEPF
ncbi:DUF6497 family protein [Pseudooceanicola sp. C21-150M6]|uniref:DUF6497 family protein n=1 Tax=Pseudooceanicola sp. C21-150M6 TaxID=3434355 RepID=UPI003D7F197C